MTNSNLIDYSDLQEEINSSIRGGLDGLETLFNRHINSLLRKNLILSHTNFKEFYKGRKIEFLGVKHSSVFDNKIESLNFDDFFEKYFIFEVGELNVFYNTRNILHHTLYKLREFILNEKFSENQKTVFLNELVMHINLQITKSQEVKKSENKILYDKLIYISNGYKLILNSIHGLYSNYITNDVKNNTTNLKKEKNNTREEIIKKLTNGNQIEKFNEFDRMLKKEKYIDENYKWIKSDADFVRFYNYLEEKKITMYHYEDTSVGIKLLRELYDFSDLSNLNTPYKRKIQNIKSQERQFHKILD